MGGVNGFDEAIVGSLDRQIREAEAKVEALKAKRQAALIPAEPSTWGAVIKQSGMVPAFKIAPNRWVYVTTHKGTGFTWPELLEHGGKRFEVLYSKGY